MGAQGIKRRKRKHGPPKYASDDAHDFTDDLQAGDQRRLFGRFTWSAYSPAGNLERNGFFLRQLGRHGTEHAGRNALRLLYLSLPAIAAVFGAVVLFFYVLSHIH